MKDNLCAWKCDENLQGSFFFYQKSDTIYRQLNVPYQWSGSYIYELESITQSGNGLWPNEWIISSGK
jgi:hypothetical protein